MSRGEVGEACVTQLVCNEWIQTHYQMYVYTCIHIHKHYHASFHIGPYPFGLKYQNTMKVSLNVDSNIKELSVEVMISGQMTSMAKSNKQILEIGFLSDFKVALRRISCMLDPKIKV